MSYTRSWSDVIPSGGSQASSIDESIQAVRVDIHERMNDIFDNWIDGPLALKSSVVGAVDNKTMIVGPFAGHLTNDEDNLTASDGHITGDATPSRYRLQLDLPVGAKITRIQYLVDKNLGTTVNAELKKSTFSVTPANVNVHPLLSTSNSGPQILDTGSIDVTIEVDAYYVIIINGDAAYSFYAAKVYYNTPGLAAVR